MKFLNWLFKEDETTTRLKLETGAMLKLVDRRQTMSRLHCPEVGKNCINEACVNYRAGNFFILENVNGELISVINPPRCKLWRN